jgi:hypothetical protein
MKFTPEGNMLETEEDISAVLNSYGAVLTEHCLSLYGAD